MDENNPVFCSLDGVLFDKAMTTLIWFPQGKKGIYSIPEGIIKTSSGAFYNCKLTGISLPQSFIFPCIGLNRVTTIEVSEQNPSLCSIDGVLFTKKKDTLCIYSKNSDKTGYVVPDETSEITFHAFYECIHLVNITLPENLKFIFDYAFVGCKGIKAITLPNSLQYIGEHAFLDCSNLETVTLSRKTRIGHKAFEGFTGQFVYRD